MYRISICSLNPTVVFAAEELKKYLRMMMPRSGNVPVYMTDQPNTFRLGLMQDFGLDMSDAEKPELDDIIYIDATETEGIIAGSNPGALLIAVYRYLRFCGCRWLFPGVDGEWIPTRTSLEPVKYRKLADHRYRGQCNEGAEFQTDMLETIDFTPKIGMNTYMLEFDIPFVYYNHYYSHHGSSVRKPEPINNEMILQWKRQCEAEIQKRGLHFHDMGHGWTAEPFGFDSISRSGIIPDVPEEEKRFIALTNGKRDFRGRVIDTNVCMSNPACRKIMVDYIADYAETQNNVDFLHIWLADGTNNHCECEVCRTKTVSDWYVVLLNDLDAEFTRRGLDTRLVFIQYFDTFWAPAEEKIKNPDRFTMLYAPITRSYLETYGEEPDESAVVPFNLNKNVMPFGMSACLGYLNAWKKVWPGDCFCYEYHFWRFQNYDISGLHIAKLIYDDVQALRSRGLSGIVEDGSQRSYFPTGFAFYVYGETLFDASRSFEELAEDYFGHAFGSRWKEVYHYLEQIRDAIDYGYLCGLRSADLKKGAYYNPAMTEKLERVPAIVASMQEVVNAESNQPMRASAVAWQLLQHHLDFAREFAEAVSYTAVDEREKAKKTFTALMEDFSNREIYIERYYDQFQFECYLSRVIENKVDPAYL